MNYGKKNSNRNSFNVSVVLGGFQQFIISIGTILVQRFSNEEIGDTGSSEV